MPTTDSPNGLERNEPDTSQSDFLENPLVKAFIYRVSQRLSKEKTNPPRLQPLTAAEKFTVVILPALLIGGFGVLAIEYPHFLSDFDFRYIRGNNFSAIFIFLFLLFIKLAWNQVGVSVAITLSTLAIIKCLLPNKPEPIEYQLPHEGTQKTFKQESIYLGLQTGIKVGKNVIQRRRSGVARRKAKVAQLPEDV